MTPQRRGCRAPRTAVSPAALCLLFALWSGVGLARADTPRVATVDWAQAETLIALGVPPVGLAQTATYRDWVGSDLPDTTRDIGLRAQPNMELLAQMDIDLFTLSPTYAFLRPRLARIAPVRTVAIYGRPGDVWSNLADATRRLGTLVGRGPKAEQLVTGTEARIAALAERVPAATPPLLVVQFMDARHVRVFGPDSLYGAVLDRLGLGAAWQGDTTSWDYALVPLQRLAQIRPARLVVVDPLPVGVAGELSTSVLWRHLPAVHDHAVMRLPAVWGFGGLPSGERFAREIVTALNKPAAQPGALPAFARPR